MLGKIVSFLKHVNITFYPLCHPSAASIAQREGQGEQWHKDAYICSQEHGTENMMRRYLIGALFAMVFYCDSGAYKYANHSHS